MLLESRILLLLFFNHHRLLTLRRGDITDTYIAITQIERDILLNNIKLQDGMQTV